jgi:hypothetical protein
VQPQSRPLYIADIGAPEKPLKQMLLVLFGDAYTGIAYFEFDNMSFLEAVDTYHGMFAGEFDRVAQ